MVGASYNLPIHPTLTVFLLCDCFLEPPFPRLFLALTVVFFIVLLGFVVGFVFVFGFFGAIVII